jgi:hypothetical protein
MIGKGGFVLSLVILAMFGLIGEAAAQEGIQRSISMYKDISSLEERYAIRFDLNGDPLREADRILIGVPSRRKIRFHNALRFNTFQLSRDGMSFAEFHDLFPEGEYDIVFTPKELGRFRVNMVYSFPSVVITSPADGSGDIPRSLTAQWEPIRLVDRLEIRLSTATFEYSVGLPQDATSYKFYGQLDPDTRYDLSLKASLTDFEGNNLVTTRTISFTTKAE